MFENFSALDEEKHCNSDFQQIRPDYQGNQVGNGHEECLHKSVLDTNENCENSNSNESSESGIFDMEPMKTDTLASVNNSFDKILMGNSEISEGNESGMQFLQVIANSDFPNCMIVIFLYFLVNY